MRNTNPNVIGHTASGQPIGRYNQSSPSQLAYRADMREAFARDRLEKRIAELEIDNARMKR